MTNAELIAKPTKFGDYVSYKMGAILTEKVERIKLKAEFRIWKEETMINEV